MNEILSILLRIAGAGLILLTFVHIPIGRTLNWKEDARKLSPVNEQVFHVHTFFLCLVIFMMGLPCLLMPSIFLEKSPAGFWVAGSFAVFWGARLYFQFFVYRSDLWRGKRIETFVHGLFAVIWTSLTALFGACVAIQFEWLK